MVSLIFEGERLASKRIKNFDWFIAFYPRLIVSKPPNVGVDAAGDNCVTDKLSMTSPLVPLASDDLFDGVWVNERVRVRTLPKAPCGRKVLHPCFFNPAKFARTLSGW